MTLANLESISIRTIYDNRMASVGLSDIIMDTTSTVFSFDGQPKNVEECRSLSHSLTSLYTLCVIKKKNAHAHTHVIALG